MPIVDGWTPITAEDLQIYQELIAAVQEVLGAGRVDAAGTIYGPKASNPTLADRLDQFLDDEGGLRDIVFLTGTKQLGEFSEDGVGARFSFSPKVMTRSGENPDSYVILLDFQSPETVDVGGVEYWDLKVPCIWAPTARAPDFCTVWARNMNGNRIQLNDSTQVRYQFLAIGYEAYYT